MEKFSLVVNRANKYISCTVLVGLMLLTVTDVLGRYLFNNPIRGTYELTELAMVIVIILSLGYAEHERAHITIDLVYERVTKGKKFVLDLFSTSVYLIIVILLTRQFYIYSGQILAGGYETAVLRIPIYYILLIALAGLICFVLSVASTLIKHITKQKGDEK